MNSKTKFFSKGLIKADLKRFWVFGVIYAAMIFLTSFFVLFLTKDVQTGFDGTTYKGSMLCSYSTFTNFLGILFGGVLAPALFSFLKSERGVSFYHGLPQSRGKIYVSKLVAAAALLILPVLANAGFAVLSRLLGSDMPARYVHILTWTGIQIVYSLAAFAFITLISSFTGNTFSLLLLSGACFIAPALLLSFIDEINSLYLLGYAKNTTKLLDYVYITPFQMASPYILIYIFFTALFLVLAFFLYRARPLERSGEALTFKSAKVVFIYAAAVLGGIIGYWYLSIWFDKSIFFMLPFGIASIIIANMINQKSITLKKAPLYTGIFVLAVLLIYCGFKIDFTGFEKRMPSADKIESVLVYSDNPSLSTSNDYTYYDMPETEHVPDFHITDKNEIENVLKYHKFKIDEGKLGKNYNNTHIYLEYRLSGGKKLLRRYSFDKAADKEFFEPIATTDTSKRQRYEIYQRNSEDVLAFIVRPVPFSYGTVTLYPDSDGFSELYEALQKDIKNLSYDDDPTLCTTSVWAPQRITVSIQGSVNYGRGFSPEILITDGFTETKAVINKYNFSVEGYTPDDIIKIEADGTEITDKTQILETVENVMHSYENAHLYNGNGIQYEFYFANGDSYNFYLNTGK